MEAQRPPFSVKVIFALGQLGWSLASFGAANLLVYFFLPPESSAGQSVFPVFIFQGTVFGLATLVGLINFGGRIFDAITDPLVANWSDKTDSRYGKRKKLMAIAVVPFALFSFLIFYPLEIGESGLNAAWLVVCIMLFYLAMTIYVIPFTALIGELGHHPDDRMSLSTLISITWALGFLIGSNAYSLQSLFENHFSAVQSFQMVCGIFSGLAFLLMLVPIFFLKESKYCRQSISAVPPLEAIKTVFKSRNFRFFAFSDLMYWLALTFIQLGVSYFVMVLFGFEKTSASVFLTIGFLGSFALYLPVNYFVKKWGKKPVVEMAFLVFMLIFLWTAVVDWIPLGKDFSFYALAVLSGFPLAAFGIIPNALVADLIYESERETGLMQSGMFYAVRNFMMKMGISLANLIFPSLILLGKSVQNPDGVRLAAIFALGFCLVGWLIFRNFKESKIGF